MRPPFRRKRHRIGHDAMAGGAETSNSAALPAIMRLGARESARGPDANRQVKLLIQFALEGHSRALIHSYGSRLAIHDP
jgi:hypothetical protein